MRVWRQRQGCRVLDQLCRTVLLPCGIYRYGEEIAAAREPHVASRRICVQARRSQSKFPIMAGSTFRGLLWSSSSLMSCLSLRSAQVWALWTEGWWFRYQVCCCMRKRASVPAIACFLSILPGTASSSRRAAMLWRFRVSILLHPAVLLFLRSFLGIRARSHAVGDDDAMRLAQPDQPRRVRTGNHQQLCRLGVLS